jgi:hypothetical protein
MKKIIYTLSAAMLLFSCTEEAEIIENDTKDVVVDTDEDIEEEEELINEVVYTIPSPQEQFDQLQMLGGDMNTSLAHDLSIAEDYNTIESKSLAFGVYSADAAYMMRYDQGKKVFMDYITALEKIGDKLGISQMYGEDFIAEVEALSDDPEALFELSSDNIISVYNNMIENDKGVELSLILAGGFIQTMHILFETCGSFEGDLLVQELIKDEQLVLENLIVLLSDYTDNTKVESVQMMLKEFDEMYYEMDCTSTEVEVKKLEGSRTLFGGASCVFTEEVYDKMHEYVKKMRQEII